MWHLKYVIHLMDNFGCLKTWPEWTRLQDKESSALFCSRGKIFWVSGCSPGERSWGGLEIRKEEKGCQLHGWRREGRRSLKRKVGQWDVPFAERGEELLRSRCLIVASFLLCSMVALPPTSTHSSRYFQIFSKKPMVKKMQLAGQK